MLSLSEFWDFESDTGVVLLDAIDGHGGKAQSRLESSGEGGLAREGIVIPREGARNGERLADVLRGEKA